MYPLYSRIQADGCLLRCHAIMPKIYAGRFYKHRHQSNLGAKEISPSKRLCAVKVFGHAFYSPACLAVLLPSEESGVLAL